MARFSAHGLDEFIAEMKKEGGDIDMRADRVLRAGAEEVKKAWCAVAEEKELRDTGKMIASIGYSEKIQTVDGIKAVEIYPQGVGTYTSKGGGTQKVRHAEKAYILHWGTQSKAAIRRRKNKKFSGPGIPRTLWVDVAQERAAVTLVDAMRKAWEEEK